jgi:hypothetical protein
MEAIREILNQYQPITLEEMDQVKLLDRVDTKFAFNRSQLYDILEKVSDHYFVLQINKKRISQYESLYFDTPDFSLYNDHYCGKLNRFKIRLRRYVDSNLDVLEIKYKNNKYRTVKKRFPIKDFNGTLSPEALAFLKENDINNISKIEKKFWVDYKRITLVSKSNAERVTVDIDLSYRDGVFSKVSENLIIAEVKQDRSGNSAFAGYLKQLHIRSGSMSKYCYGVALLYPAIRHNNFKPQMHLFNKIIYDTAAGSYR